jgi:transmembrane 9 superfamily member 1
MTQLSFFRPFNNPTETYRYYSLNFCRQHEYDAPEEIERAAMIAMERKMIESGNHYDGALRHRQRLGQSLVGDARETSPYQITFLDVIDWRLLCSKRLRQEDLRRFKDAIVNSYFFEMFIEDIPMWVSNFLVLKSFSVRLVLCGSVVITHLSILFQGIHW